MKIEAMTTEEIRECVVVYSQLSHEHGSIYGDVMRLILAWATAKAEAERLEFWRLDEKYDDRRWDWTDADWLPAVLQRIGWPKDDGQGEK